MGLEAHAHRAVRTNARPLSAPLLGAEVEHSRVQGSPVVPESDIADRPPPPNYELRSKLVSEQKVQDRLALPLRQADDPLGVLFAHPIILLPGLRDDADHGVAIRRHEFTKRLQLLEREL